VPHSKICAVPAERQMNRPGFRGGFSCWVQPPVAAGVEHNMRPRVRRAGCSGATIRPRVLPPSALRDPRTRKDPESNTAHKQRATGHNRQFIAHAQIRQAPGNRRQAEQGYRTQVLRIAPATGTAAAHPPQARTRFPPHPGPREAPRCHDRHKLTQQTPGRGDPETSCQEQKPRSEA
jgi:hypothetical protein